MPGPRILMSIMLSTFVLLVWRGPGYCEEYNRDLFPHWLDRDGDGWDTREEVLKRDSIAFVVISEERKIELGTWVCPYTGIVIRNPSGLDIDHIVPLKWAWDHGADKWSDSKRKSFANDCSNLVAVVARVNRAKGSKGPYYWMPPNLSYSSTYIHKFISVVKNYQLDCPKDCYRALSDALEDTINGIKIQQFVEN